MAVGPAEGMHLIPFQPVKAQGSLLSSAYVIEYTEDQAGEFRWENGLEYIPQGCNEVVTHDPCPVDEEGNPLEKDEKPSPEEIGSCICEPKTLIGTAKCSTRNKLNFDQMAAYARRELEVGLCKGVECLYYNEGCLPVSDPACVLYGGAPVSLDTAIAGLEQYLANCGSGLVGAIHLPAGISTKVCQCQLAERVDHNPLYDPETGLPRGWSRSDLIPQHMLDSLTDSGIQGQELQDAIGELERMMPDVTNRFATESVLQTCGRGNLVIAGGGYSGLGPGEEPADPPTGEASTKVWIYATGIPLVLLGPVCITPDNLSQAMHRKVNMVEVRAERSAMVLNPTCCHAAVCVDLCLPACCCK